MTDLRSVGTLVEACAHWDKDERYMALNDLTQQLTREDTKINVREEGRIVTAVLKALTDINNDVKSAAVKCVAVLVIKVEKAQIEVICRTLTDLIRSETREDVSLRDIYGIALKTLIEQVDQLIGNEVAPFLAEKLLASVNLNVTDIKRECLSLLDHLLRRFGSQVGAQHSSIMKVTLRQLSIPGPDNKSVRKLAIDTLGSLAVVVSDELLNVMVDTLLESIEKVGGISSSTEMVVDDSSSDSRTLIQTIGTISRTVGHRLGRHLKKIVPLLIGVIGEFSHDDADEDRDMTLLNEIREYCFSGLESFVKCCPDQIAPHVIGAQGEKGILQVAMSYIRYDPNYVGDDGDDEEENDMDLSDEEDYIDDDYDDDYGDDADDDTSWKVRRAAACVVRAIITARWAEMGGYFFDACVDELINRFKERSELVRVDVIACIFAILEAMSTRKRLQMIQGGRNLTPIPLSPRLDSSNSLSHLNAKVPAITSAVCKVLAGPDKELASKSTVLNLANKLLDVRDTALDKPLYDDLLGVLVQGLVNDKLKSLRLSQMRLLRSLIAMHPHDMIQESLNKTNFTDRLNIFSITIAATHEAGYKNVAEALHVAATLIPKLRPVTADGTGFESDAVLYRDIVKRLYAGLLNHLEAQDVDQEIKRCAISCVGTLYYHFGDSFNEELSKALQLLLVKLENEVTRVATLQALRQMAESPLRLNMSPILTSESIMKIAHFLKQQSRDTRQASVELLNSILKTNPVAFSSSGVDVVVALVKVVSNMVDIVDLHLAAQALNLLKVITTSTTQEHFTGPLKESLIPRLMRLASSPFLHGACQEAVVDFLQHLVQHDYPSMGFKDLLAELYTDSSLFAQRDGKKEKKSNNDNSDIDVSSSSYTDESARSGGTLRQEAQNIAYSVAGMCLGASSQVIEQTVTVFANDISKPSDSTGERRKQLALLCIGKLGQRMDLAASGALEALSLDEKVMDCFASVSTDTQAAAAFALGNLSVGNMSKYLPLLLQNMTDGTGIPIKPSAATAMTPASGVSDYLLLMSLREILQAHAVKTELSFESYFASVIPAVMPFMASSEMGERNVAAECLGIMTYLNPSTMAPELEKISNEGALDMDMKVALGSGEPEESSGPGLREINLRWSLAMILKFSISRDISGEKCAAVLGCVVKYLPSLLQDDNVDVRKAAIILTTSVVHRNRELIHSAVCSDGKPLLETVFPLLMDILEFRKVIEVDTGPFKYKEDLGLPLRKATLTCVEMILCVIPDALNFTTLIPQVIMNIGDALKVKKDHNFNDLKIHAMQLLVKLCVFAPGPMLGFAEGSLETLQKVLCEEIKESAAATDKERALDLKRAGLEVVKAFGALETMDTNPVFLDFYVRIQASQTVAELMKGLKMSALRN